MTHAIYPRTLLTAFILLAEDDDDLRCILSHTMRQGGHSVREVTNTVDFEKIIIKLQNTPPEQRAINLIVSDIHLENGSILPILKKYRSFISAFPTILITSDRSPDVVDAAMTLGVKDVLAKPFDLPFLMDTIHRTRAAGVTHRRVTGAPGNVK
ncbi:MAG: response regulator [Deltaproteobacteria bacterium]|nr:response regulator [Deltaproteobacteria bacterium]MBN2673879.1 response regulator [Deltaproteobacteria bacterium]